MTRRIERFINRLIEAWALRQSNKRTRLILNARKEK